MLSEALKRTSGLACVSIDSESINKEDLGYALTIYVDVVVRRMASSVIPRNIGFQSGKSMENGTISILPTKKVLR